MHLKLREGDWVGEVGTWVEGRVRSASGTAVDVAHFFPLAEAAGRSSRSLKREARAVALREAGEDDRATGWRRVAVAAMLSIAAYFVGCATVPADPAPAASSAQPAPTSWPRERWEKWCRKPWIGSNEEKALCFLRAHAERTDIAACKAAIWLGEADRQRSREIHMVAARSMLDDLPREVIIAAVRRDAHLFGVDPDATLDRLWKAMNR